MSKRKKPNTEFKAKVALEMLKGERTLANLVTCPPESGPYYTNGPRNWAHIGQK